MKTKLLLSVLLFPTRWSGSSIRSTFFFCLFTFVFCLGKAQVPQGFNYQAIARDGSGNVIPNQPLPVKIDIVDALSAGNLIYEELFSSITSNQFGLISLVVGTGTPQSGGKVTSFSAIDWKSKPLYIRTIIEYPGTTWTTMGTSQIMSVPYTLIAKDVQGPVTNLTSLGITGTTDVMDSALFAVRNKAGNIVFAVYNEGIRAYVGNGSKGAKGGFAVGGYDATKGSTVYDLFALSTDSARIYVDSKPNLKGARGGFSVGGYDMTKGTVQDYLDISKDSARIYVDSNPATKGAKGGFSVGGYDMTKGGVAAQNYLDVSKDSVRIYIDSNPATKGVRGGFAVGGYDMTKGGSTNYLNVNTDTSGIIRPSQNRILWYPIKDAFLTGRVLVEKPDSVGTNSFASGFESKAKGQYSQALGYKAIARGNYSTSIGFQSVAQDSNSFAFGQDAFAFGKSSYAIGNGAIAHGRGSYAFGSAGYDQYGVPTGQITQALGDFSVALGLGAKTTGRGAIAFGSNVLSTGYGAVAMGYYTSAPGACSLACNYYTVSSGSWSFASGANSQATNNYSTAMGTWTTASGSASTSMGDHTTAPSFCETAIGSFNTTYTPASTYSWNTSDRLFVIGNGTNSSPSNAVTVMKTGYTAIGNVSPTQMLDVNGNARFRTVTSGTFVSDLNLASDGTLTTATSDIRMKENIIQITNALTKVNELRGVTFTWKNDSTKTRQIGMIAQEVEPIVPEIVFTNPVDGLKGINYSQASALFVEAIKEQQKQIESQQKEIDELKTLVNTLIANQTAQVNK